MAYNYYESVKNDIELYLPELRKRKEDESINDYYEFVIETVLNEDCITGAASGSYTFNTETAKEYVKDSIELAAEAYMYFDSFSYDLACDIKNGDWETIDVAIRQYVAERYIKDKFNM